MHRIFLFVTLITISLNTKAHELLGSILVDVPMVYSDIEHTDDTVSMEISSEESDYYFELSPFKISKIYFDAHLSRERSKLAFNRLNDPKMECGRFGQRVNVRTCLGLDHFERARLAGIVTCDNVATMFPEEFEYGAHPIFTGPARFVFEGTISDDHHEYKTAEGIKFYCKRVIIASEY